MTKIIMSEREIKKNFIDENYLFFDPLDGDIDSIYLPEWTHEIFKKYFIELSLFFFDIKKPIPRIIGTRFFKNEWRVLYKTPEYSLPEDTYFRSLVSSLQDDLRSAMIVNSY